MYALSMLQVVAAHSHDKLLKRMGGDPAYAELAILGAGGQGILMVLAGITGAQEGCR
jgi:hypothetical protein